MQATRLDATSLAKEIAEGRLSAVAALEAYLAALDRHNPTLNAIIVQRREAAREEARAADAALAAGRRVGPLHGVPMTVKESFDVTGLPTTLGLEGRRDHRAGADAVVVERLRAAGAILFGKSNVPVDLADWQSANPIYGRTVNPWDTGRSAGGSSGGAAAALAAGMTALEVGSDIGGSIRVPAHFCGVYGHKPSFGVVPRRGHGLDPAAPGGDLSVAGPLARSARDLALAMGVLAGADPAEGPWQLSLPAEPRTSLREFRVAVVTDDAVFPVDAPIRAALGNLADCLEREGAQVMRDPKLPIESRAHAALYVTLLRGATSARVSEAGLDNLLDHAAGLAAQDDSYNALMLRGLTQRHAAWLKADAARHRLIQGWAGFFADYDALLCPAAPFTAFPHMEGIPKPAQRVLVNGAQRPVSDAYYWVGIPTLSYLPATTIPAGRTETGLPVGAQVIVPRWQDATALRLAALLEQSHGGAARPPGFD
jgi:amidase